MARSTYIYIAYDHYGELLVAGTVKREVIGYVKKHNRESTSCIQRYRDGKGYESTFLDLENEPYWQ